MMRSIEERYQIVKHENGFAFEIFQEKFPNQVYGYSKFYPTEDACAKGLWYVVNFVLENNINSPGSKFIKIEERELNNIKEYRYVCIDENGDALFYQRWIQNSKANSKKSVRYLYNAIDKYFNTYRRNL